MKKPCSHVSVAVGKERVERRGSVPKTTADVGLDSCGMVACVGYLAVNILVKMFWEKLSGLGALNLGRRAFLKDHLKFPRNCLYQYNKENKNNPHRSINHRKLRRSTHLWLQIDFGCLP